jgi:hypothetical protein
MSVYLALDIMGNGKTFSPKKALDHNHNSLKGSEKKKEKFCLDWNGETSCCYFSSSGPFYFHLREVGENRND